MCESYVYLRILLIVVNIFKIVCIVAPLLIIVMGIIDFSKAVTNSGADLGKVVGTFLKRVIAGIVIFILPSTISALFNGIGNYNSDIFFVSCKDNLEDIDIYKEAYEKRKREQLAETEKEIAKEIKRIRKEEEKRKSEETPYFIKGNSNKVKPTVVPPPDDIPSTGDRRYPTITQRNYGHIKFCGNGKTVKSSGCGAIAYATIAWAFNPSLFSSEEDAIEDVANYMCSTYHSGGALSAAAYSPTAAFGKALSERYHITSSGNLLHTSGYTRWNDSWEQLILNKTNNGYGVIILISGHYIVVHSSSQCGSNKVYVKYAGAIENKTSDSCYTIKGLYDKTYNYRNRCNEVHKCGWNGAWAFRG